jgi:spartin
MLVHEFSFDAMIGYFLYRYGEEAGKATNEGFDAAGHAIGTAWAVFKIRKALNPKSVFKPTTLVKAAARANSTEMKPKNIPIKD